MKKIVLGLLVMFALCGCDHEGSYTFKIKNSIDTVIEVRFAVSGEKHHSSDVNEKNSFFIEPGEEEIVRIIYAGLNERTTKESGVKYLRGLVYDIYIDGARTQCQLVWSYKSTGDWTAEYTAPVTEESINDASSI